MTILFCGGEDIDFQNQVGSGITVSTSGGTFRSGYARCTIKCAVAGNATVRSNAFPGGAITSAWLHFMADNTFSWNSAAMLLGLANTAAGNGSGIYVGANSSGKLTLYKWDGTTLTSLASGTSTLATNTVLQFDMHLASYGGSSTVAIYVGGSSTAEVTYSGSTAISGVSNLDCVGLAGNALSTAMSEIIVADADTRAMSLVTMAPNAAGDNNNWTAGTFSSINPTTINDANVISVNTTAQDFQANLIDLPSGSFSIGAIKVAARAQLTAGATPTQLKVGVRTASTNYPGTALTPATGAWTTLESFLATDPATSAAWLQSVMNALQLELQSA
jgi:hypothetical protein